MMKRRKEKKEPDGGKKEREARKKGPEEGVAAEELEEKMKGLKKDEKEVVQLSPERLQELKEKASERDKFLDLLQRARADYLNYQKRTMREMDALKTVVLCEFIKELLPVLDDFERAIESAESNRDFKSLYEGVKLIDGKFRGILKKYDVESIEVVGQVFDPHLHEAFLVEETEEYEDKTVIDEVQKGYKMPGKVLRPSRVKIAKRREKSEERQSQEQPEERPCEDAAESDKEVAGRRDAEAEHKTDKESQ